MQRATKILTASLIASTLLAAAGPARAQEGAGETFVAVLRGEEEVPPRETGGSGFAR